MAVRRIIEIDETRCNGCGLCAEACHEGAIAIVDGVAKLPRDDYCDGFGDCLPACPMDAIRFVEREAAAYDEAAVEANKRAKAQAAPVAAAAPAIAAAPGAVPNEISTWPIQIKLVNPSAPYFDGCDLLVAADCTAFAYGNFHHDFMRGRVTVIGCPKLDGVDYSEKLAAILSANDVQSILFARMIVPCCGGLERAVRNAIAASGKSIPLEVVTFALDGTLM